MILPNHSRFIKSVVDLISVTKVLPFLILIYTRDVLSKKENIDGEENGQNFAKMLFATVESIEVQRCRQMLDGLAEYLPIQKFSSHDLYHLSTFLSVEKLFKMTRNVPEKKYGGK